MIEPALAVDPSPFDADAVYLQTTLRHEPMEIGLDDSVSLGTIFLIVARAVLASMFMAVVLGLVLIVLLISGHGAPWPWALLAEFAVFVAVLFRFNATEPIGEWRVLLPDRAGQVDRYQGDIGAVLERRQPTITVRESTPGPRPSAFSCWPSTSTRSM